MIELDSSHCGIVAGSLTGERQVDEQTFASLAVLGERLDRLKGIDDAFSGITFSSAANELQAAKNAVAVG